MNDEQPKRTVGRKFGRYMLMSIVPFYPIYSTLRSMKTAAGAGKDTLKDINDKLPADDTRKKVVTFQEACDNRPEGAMTILEVTRLCLRRKRITLACAFVSASFLVGSTVGENYLGTALGILLLCFWALLLVKFEHQIWQIEEGLSNPDVPLGSYRDFFRSKGSFRRLLYLHISG